MLLDGVGDVWIQCKLQIKERTVFGEYGKRQDGRSLITLSATCVHTLAKSCISRATKNTGSAAKSAEEHGVTHYRSLVGPYIFASLGFESLGSWRPSTKYFVLKILSSKEVVDPKIITMMPFVCECVTNIISTKINSSIHFPKWKPIHSRQMSTRISEHQLCRTKIHKFTINSISSSVWLTRFYYFVSDHITELINQCELNDNIAVCRYKRNYSFKRIKSS